MQPIYSIDKIHKRTYSEIVPNADNQAFIFRIFKDERIHDFRHKHNEIEIIYIVNGQGTKTIGDNIERCHNGDVSMIGEGVPHYYTVDPVNKDKNVEAWVIQFDKYVFGPRFYEFAENLHLKNLFNQAKEGISFTGKTLAASHKVFPKLVNKTGTERIVLLLKMLDIFSKPGSYKPIIGSTPVFHFNTNNSSRMQNIRHYIHQHYAEKIRLEELAGKTHLSKPAFCNLFKKTFNVCYSDYLAEVRLCHAAKLLAETDLSIGTIISHTGFSNQSYFNRCFKSHYRKTPLRYRKSLHNPFT